MVQEKIPMDSSIREQNWQQHYDDLVEFVKVHNRYPSRHHVEEHRLLNWLKYQRKKRNQGLLSDDEYLKLKNLNSMPSSKDDSLCHE